VSESLSSVRTVLAFNAAARTADEYDEVSTRSLIHPLRLPGPRGLQLLSEYIYPLSCLALLFSSITTRQYTHCAMHA